MASLWKHLTRQEIADFRLWARQNYKTYDFIYGTWHPIIQDECVRMNEETGYGPRALPWDIQPGEE